MNKLDINVYDKIAQHFNNTRIYQWKWVTEFLNSVENGCIVYDIGCGNGRNMDNDRLLMYGIDSCKSFVKMCNQKGLNVFEACMTSLPFRSESADAIICIASFHHLKTVEERLKSLKEMKRVLKKKRDNITIHMVHTTTFKNKTSISYIRRYHCPLEQVW